jgi:hypothetical protein
MQVPFGHQSRMRIVRLNVEQMGSVCESRQTGEAGALDWEAGDEGEVNGDR